MIMGAGFSGFIILVATGLSQVILPSLLGVGNIEILNQANFAAEGALEDALYEISQHESGFEHQEPRSTFSTVNQTQTRWQIISRSVSSGGNFIVPAPGEGDSPSDEDWNYINVGESVTADLFLDTSSAGSVVTDADIENPSDYFLNNLQLKIRTPDTNPLFQTLESEQFGIADDTIVSWSFSGEEFGGVAKYNLREAVEYDNSDPPSREVNDSTEIYESKIDAVSATDNVVIDTAVGSLISQFSPIGSGINQDNTPQEILDFLTNTPNIHKPQLTFTVISSLEADDGSNIPFLEYQVIADQQIPDIYTTVIAEGFAQGFKQTIRLRRKNESAAALLDFAVSQ